MAMTEPDRRRSQPKPVSEVSEVSENLLLMLSRFLRTPVSFPEYARFSGMSEKISEIENH
jgi:hypothetical protein